jgi:hypothetical protein
VKRSGRRGVAWHDKIAAAAAVLVGRCARWAGWRGVDSAPSHPILASFRGAMAPRSLVMGGFFQKRMRMLAVAFSCNVCRRTRGLGLRLVCVCDLDGGG